MVKLKNDQAQRRFRWLNCFNFDFLNNYFYFADALLAVRIFFKFRAYK